MDYVIKNMETEAEIKGKAYVHWQSWHEAYPGLVDRGYLNALTLEKCEAIARKWPDNTLVAKDGEHVIGFLRLRTMPQRRSAGGWRDHCHIRFGGLVRQRRGGGADAGGAG